MSRVPAALCRLTLTRHTAPRMAASASTSALCDCLWAKNLAHNQSIIQRRNVAEILEAYTLPPLMIGLTVTKQFR